MQPFSEGRRREWFDSRAEGVAWVDWCWHRVRRGPHGAVDAAGCTAAGRAFLGQLRARRPPLSARRGWHQLEPEGAQGGDCRAKVALLEAADRDSSAR